MDVVRILVPALVLVLGLVLFLATKNNADVKEIGKITFFVGLLWTVYVIATKTVHF